jgi:hypothetical protein
MPDTPQVKPPVVTPVRVIVVLCLAAPIVAMLWVTSYTRTDPTFIGMPFFYWYQIAWVLITTVLTATAHQLWLRDQRARAAAAASATTPAASDGGASE